MNKIIIPSIIGVLLLTMGLVGNLAVEGDQGTKSEVKEFQKKKKLGADGLVQPKTITALIEVARTQISSANHLYPSVSDCGEPEIVDDVLYLPCGDEVIVLNKEDLQDIENALAGVKTEIDEMQNQQTDWEFILERARDRG